MPISQENDDILIYIPSFAGGGVERVFVRISNELNRQGHSIKVVVNSSKGPTRALLSESIPVIDLQASRTRHAIRPLTRLLAQVRPAAVISALTYNNFTALLAKQRTGRTSRIIISERAHISGVVSDYTVLRRKMTLHLIRHLYRRADAITAVSRGTADDLAHLSGISRDAIHVIPNAPPDTHEYSIARDARCPHTWLKDGNGPVAIAIGRLEAQKNYPLMLEALARVRQRGHPMRLIVLGEGTLRADLISQARTLGIEKAVTFAGFVENPLHYLVRADLFLMTSFWEGYPNALLEAAAVGVPIVSTNFDGGGATEILGSHDLCPQGDLDALANAITDRLSTAQQIMPMTHKTLSIKDVADQYLDLCFGDIHASH